MTLHTFYLMLQLINVLAIVSMLICIFVLFTERQLTICTIFRQLGFRPTFVKVYFSTVAVILLIRLASYVGDFEHAWTHPASILFHVSIAYAFVRVTYQIYRNKIVRPFRKGY